MSLAKYKRITWTTYYVLWSYESYGELHASVRPSEHAKSEEEALAEAKAALMVSNKPTFTAHVIGKQVW